mgnify:CR=1 FL=1
MVTKGIVEEIINIYQAKVRLPVYDGFVDTKNATPSNELTIASICNIPNIYNTIAVGDIVYVAFEDNDLGNPVILGQLYKEEMNTLADIKVNSANINQLTINKNASLPQNTSIGSISSKEIAALSGIKDNIQNQIDTNLPAIEFAEEERQKSKNLFDYTKLTNLSGVKSNNDGSFDVNSTYYYPSARSDLQLEVGKTYTYSIDVNSYSEVEGGARIEIVLFYKDGSTWTINKAVTIIDRYFFSFAIVKEINYIEIRFIRKSKADTTALFTANVSNIQLEEGSTVTDYVPYYGQVSHTGDKEIEFSKSGYEKSKNLYNATTAQTTDGHSITYSADTSELKINGAYEDGVRCMFNTWPLKKGTYTLCISFVSGSMTRFYEIMFYLYKGTSWTQYAACPNISSSKKQVYVTFTLTEDVYDATLGLYENLSTNTMTNCVFNYQIVKGSIPDFNFQSYQGGEFVQEGNITPDLLYDMGKKSTIGGVAYTAGIPFNGTVINNIYLSKYKYLRFSCDWNEDNINNYGGMLVFDLELKIRPNDVCATTISNRPVNCTGSTALTFDLVGNIFTNIPLTSLSFYGYKITYAGERTQFTSENYLPYFRVIKIEGVK